MTNETQGSETLPASTVERAENSSASQPVVRLIDVKKRFPPVRKGQDVMAVNGVSLEIPRRESGQFVAFLGPSGCGKSTLLNMISGLLLPDAGTVETYGERVTGPSRHSVTVPQSYTCYPWLTALGNVEFGLAVLGKSKQERRQIATEYLQKVGLGDRLDAYPKQLSGGMQQRVAIARTLAMKVPLVLMDEPFGALDAQTRSEMQQMLLHLWAEEKSTIIFVTHDISEALLLSDRLIVFSASPARIVLDREVPFPRPRLPELLMDSTFIHYAQLVLQTLTQTGHAAGETTAASTLENPAK